MAFQERGKQNHHIAQLCSAAHRRLKTHANHATKRLPEAEHRKLTPSGPARRAAEQSARARGRASTLDRRLERPERRRRSHLEGRASAPVRMPGGLEPVETPA